MAAVTHISSLVPQGLRPGGTDLSMVSQPEKLTEKEHQIAKATRVTPQNPRIGQTTQQQREVVARRIRKESLGRLGHNAKLEQEETEVLRYIVTTILKYPTLTVAEIIHAVDRGLDGEFLREGQVLFFSIANLSLWLKAYIAETKAPVMKKLARLQQDDKTEGPGPSYAERKALAIKVINMYLDMRKANPEHRVEWGCSSIFDDLSRLDLYTHSDDEKAEAINEIRRLRPNIDPETLVTEMKKRLYNSFIDSLLMFQNRLGADGRPVQDD